MTRGPDVTAHRRLGRFVTVGACANLALLALSLLFQHLGMAPFAAGIVAYALAFAGAYLAQHGWTFGGGRAHGAALPRYAAAQVVCAISAGLVGQVFGGLLAAPPLLVSLSITATAGLLSYVLSAYWVFAPARA